MIFLNLILFFCTLMLFSLNSMFLGLMVIIQCFLYSFFISWLLFSSWFGYILFIIIIGGILILFIYVISMISNQLILPEEINWFVSFFLISMFLFDFSISLSKDTFFMSENVISEVEFNIFMFTIHFFSSIKMSIFFMVYLFYCMVAVVFLVDLKDGSFFSI